MRSRPTLAMLARYCYPDVSPWTLSLREVERLNVKPTSVVWRVRLLVRGQSRTLYLKHCYGKKAYLQTRLYKSRPRAPKIPADHRCYLAGSRCRRSLAGHEAHSQAASVRQLPRATSRH